jgi:3-deoxy-D-manno-octulosonic acid kinase
LKKRVDEAKRLARTGQSVDSPETGAKLAWGVSPEGFSRVIDRHGNRLVVRQDQIANIDFSLCQADSDKSDCEPRYYGRGAIRTHGLANGYMAVVRPYFHGGAFRRITRYWFFSWPPRPFRELSITEELRRRGLRTLEVYAACVSRPCGPFYRAWLITRQLPDAEDLWSALKSGFVERVGFERTLRIVAESIAALHREGVYHADLNLKNILLRAEGADHAAYIIDFDKAKVFLGRLPASFARKNLARLKRSARKLDPEQKFFTAAAWDRFVSYYHAASGS